MVAESVLRWFGLFLLGRGWCESFAASGIGGAVVLFGWLSRMEWWSVGGGWY
jgi:hypothetical protein